MIKDVSNYVDYSGCLFQYDHLYAETQNFFKDYTTENNVSQIAKAIISVTSAYMEENRWLVDEDEQSMPFLEFQSLMLATGNALLEHKRALFHGAALLWKEYAWIITAPSGTGKTTQLRHWRNILKKEVKIINGDKPLLECREDGSVRVHSSPWRGKEKLGLPGLSAPLGGIIFLKQGPENQIRRLSTSEAVRPLFVEFVSYPENTDQLKYQSQILNQMLDAVPVWELTNLGNEDSALLTHKTLTKYLAEDLK